MPALRSRAFPLSIEGEVELEPEPEPELELDIETQHAIEEDFILDFTEDEEIIPDEYK